MVFRAFLVINEVFGDSKIRNFGIQLKKKRKDHNLNCFKNNKKSVI